MLVELVLNSVEFSCGNSVLNVRSIDGDQTEEMKYQTNKDLHNSTFTTTAVAVTLQFMAPRRSCRINIRASTLSTMSKPITFKDISTLSHLMLAESDTSEDAETESETSHVSAIILIILAFLITSTASCICLMFQFEYRRKKYLTWKSLPSSASTPSISMTMTIKKSLTILRM